MRVLIYALCDMGTVLSKYKAARRAADADAYFLGS